jgi:hypothetical protein
MEGSQENPICIDNSPEKLIITESKLLPRKFGQYAQKQLELYCRLHQKEKLIQAKLDRLAVQQNNAIYSPERSDKLWTRSTAGHRILNRIFKQKLAIFDKAYDEGWHSWLPDHIASEDHSPPPKVAEPSSLLSSIDFPKTQLPNLLRVLTDDAASPRNRILTMMALELGCNASILLALSVAWPEPVRVVWPFTLDCGFRFVYNWEPESSFESRKGVELLSERVDDDLVLIAEEKVRLLFHPFNISEEYWSRQWVSGPALFARFGIEMK